MALALDGIDSPAVFGDNGSEADVAVIEVVSELRKTRPNRGVKAWSDAQPADSFFLSTVTFAEIRFGLERQPDPMLREELETWLAHRLRPWFEGRILPVDEDVILEWR